MLGFSLFIRIEVKFQRLEDNKEMVDLLFDCREENINIIEKLLPENSSLEKIDVLPSWVKSFLLRFGGDRRFERDRYGREKYDRPNQRDYRS